MLNFILVMKTALHLADYPITFRMLGNKSIKAQLIPHTNILSGMILNFGISNKKSLPKSFP